MSRNRKPLEMQKGHLTDAIRQKKEMAEELIKTDRNQLEDPPDWLINETAKKEWVRVVKELEKIGIVGNLDMANIGGYCNAFANYVKATEEMSGQSLFVKKETRTGVCLVKHPLVDIQKMYSDEMRKFASLCGLTIDSRLKAGTVKVEKDQGELENMFGDI